MLAKLYKLALIFGKIGLFSFGGGNSMLFLIQEECVDKNHWLKTEDYTSMMGMSFIFPGLTAVKVAGMIGYQVAGVAGLAVSVLALNLPGMLLMLGCYTLITTYQANPLVAKTMTAMRYAAVVMIAAVIYSFIMELGKGYFSIMAAVLSVIYFVMIAVFNTNAILSLIGFLGIFVWLA